MATTTAACKDGYLCSAGSIAPTGFNSQECPQGSYCVAGVETTCTVGTFNTETAASSSADCIPCYQGFYCTNTISSKTACPAGYTCAEGLSSSTGKVACTIGHYCPSGSSQPLQCAHGTFQDTIAQTTCKNCTQGNICNGLGLTAETPCPSFRTCPANSIRGQR